MTTFAEIVDGVGLDEVPANYRKELCCCYCLGSDTGRGKLYSDRGQGFRWGTLAEIRRGLDDVRNHCYCKHHAVIHFAD